MKTMVLAATAALALTIGAGDALAKKGGGGPGWAGHPPASSGMGRKVGWDDGRPHGWTQGKKKGWKGRHVPPGWMR